MNGEILTISPKLTNVDLKKDPSDNFSPNFFVKKVRDFKSNITFLFLGSRSSSLDMFEPYGWKRKIRGIFENYTFGGGIIYLGHGISTKCDISEMKINTTFYEYIEDLDDLCSPKM